MKRIFLAAMLLTGQAYASDLVFREGDDVIRLQDKPCINEVALEQVLDVLKPLFKQATAIVSGKTFAPCWSVYRGTVIYLSYEDGESGTVDMRSFAIDAGV